MITVQWKQTPRWKHCHLSQHLVQTCCGRAYMTWVRYTRGTFWEGTKITAFWPFAITKLPISVAFASSGGIAVIAPFAGLTGGTTDAVWPEAKFPDACNGDDGKQKGINKQKCKLCYDVVDNVIHLRWLWWDNWIIPDNRSILLIYFSWCKWL